MKKLLAVTAAAVVVLPGTASTALAQGEALGVKAQRHDLAHKQRHTQSRHRKANRRGRSFKCKGSLTGVTIKTDLVVPRNAACTLTKSTVKGDVAVRGNAYLQATGTSIRGDVRSDSAETLFIDSGSSVAGKLVSHDTAQVFAFDSTIKGGIGVYRATRTVNVCGNTVKGTGITIRRSEGDILVGDPLAIDCPGNTVASGSVLISHNNTAVELVVRGNSIRKGSMSVLANRGSAAKFVQSNTGRKTLRCAGNGGPFVGAPNPAWSRYVGQCTA